MGLVGCRQLLVGHRAVLGTIDRPEHADGRRLEGTAGEAGQHERHAGIFPCLVVPEQGVLADVGHIDQLSTVLGVDHDPPLAVLAEPDGLAVSQRDQHRCSLVLRSDLAERPIVEDVAVLVDLDERRALVGVSPPERLHHVVAVHVVGSGHETRLGPEGDAHGVERTIEAAERRRLGDLAHFGGG